MCMYRIYLRMYVQQTVNVCMYVCMYVRMYVRMYVCMNYDCKKCTYTHCGIYVMEVHQEIGMTVMYSG